MNDSTAVKVALRIRPLSTNEQNNGCQNVLEVYNQLSQIRIRNREQAFTFSYVFDYQNTQEQVYTDSVQPLIEKLFSGYNVTILAYGQTGSGKTYSMGTCYAENGENELNVGIIPRAVADIFKKINASNNVETTVTVTFMELYKEVLYDLLSEKNREQSVIDIREDIKQIVFPGLTEITTDSAEGVLKCLSRGSKFRATGSTAMNAHSSRSHAVFTINLILKGKTESEGMKTAKFHLVDLAGSERSKKTGATGITFKEGININQGLLALGNVISSLGDDQQKKGFINYRDSNLTRLLKDSLGGNSITLMVACVSPADSNLEETLCTLRYADRALKIKNKPIVNQDAKEAQIISLQKLVQDLRVQLANQGGTNVCPAEIELKLHEHENLKQRVRELTVQMSNTLNEYTTLFERNMIIQESNDKTMTDLQEFQKEYNEISRELTQIVSERKLVEVQSYLVKLNDLFMEKICKLLGQFKNCDNQVIQFDVQSHLTMLVNNNSVSDVQGESEFTAQQDFTKQQMELNVQLQDLTKRLAFKEDLAQRIALNNNQIIDYDAVAENETKLLALQKEKDELLQQLKDAQASGISSKIAEQRRKKVQELEQQISDLNKKVQEQARLIKLKEKDDAKIKSLNSEISSMKHSKVQLVRNMRAQSEKFRVWRLERERELCKLKDQDRKRQNQIVKMETIHQRQQNVMKRKMEHVATINKRLTAAMVLRKNVQEQKGSNASKSAQWVASELEVHVRIIEAKETLTTLLEDRAIISGQLNEMRKDPQKKETDEYKQLKEELEQRSAQIQDLQQKILDSDSDKVKTRVDSIQSMGEAKNVVKTLFELVGNYRKNELKLENQLSEVLAGQQQQTKEIDILKHKLMNESLQHENNYSVIQKEHEEKIAVLLSQMKSGNNDGTYVKPDCALQERFKNLETELQMYKEKCKALENVINNVNVSDVTTKCQTDLPKGQPSIPNGDGTFTKDEIHVKEEPKSPRPKKKAVKKSHLNHTYLKVDLIEDSSFEETYDDENDPDWRKTPIGKRLQTLKLKHSDDGLERLTSKRSSDGACTCKGNCTFKTCGCRKVDRSCSSRCKCNMNVCKNRLNQSHSETSDSMESMNRKFFDQSDDSVPSEDSFKKRRFFEENKENAKAPKTKRLYFEKSLID